MYFGKVVQLNDYLIEDLKKSYAEMFELELLKIQKYIIEDFIAGDFDTANEPVIVIENLSGIKEKLTSSQLSTENKITKRDSDVAKDIYKKGYTYNRFDDHCVSLKIYSFTNPLSNGVFLEKHILDGVNKVIIDLRDNYGGFIKAALGTASNFANRDILLYKHGAICSKEEYDIIIKNSGKKYFDGKKIAILINRNTASSSEFILLPVIKMCYSAPIIGELSSGSFGQARSFMINSDLSLQVTTKKFWDEKKILKSICPDVIINETIDSFYVGRDIYLEMAMEALNV